MIDQGARAANNRLQPPGYLLFMRRLKLPTVMTESTARDNSMGDLRAPAMSHLPGIAGGPGQPLPRSRAPFRNMA